MLRERVMPVDYDSNIFAANLKRLMERQGLKAVDLAELMGVSKSTISQWLRGAKLPRMNKVERMARILDCTTSALMEEQAAPELSRAMRELMEEIKTMTPEELSVLASTAKALKATRRKE